MRIDKFLWTIRLVKTRAIATKQCNTARVKINDGTVKASKLISLGDTVAFKVNPIWRTYKVKEIPKSRVSAKHVSQHIEELTSEKDLNIWSSVQLANKKSIKSTLNSRPTKRDRRILDGLNP